MDRVCDQLLAGAGFSLDENGGIRRRNPFHLFEYRFQSRAAAYYLLEPALIRYLLTIPEFLESPHREPPGAHTPLIGLILQRRSNTLKQDLIIEWLGQELHRSGSKRLHTHFCVAMGRNEDGRNSAVFSI
jgi:hypothetical protein